jgi:hypothetical protein
MIARKSSSNRSPGLEAPIFMPLDVNAGGQMEQVFERIEREWGQLDILLHSIAFSPRETLHGRVIDVERDGFLQAFRNSMSCWTSAKKGAGAKPRQHRRLRRGNGVSRARRCQAHHWWCHICRWWLPHHRLKLS